MNQSDVNIAFSTLNLPYTASETEVKKAYKELSSVHHPDREGGNTEKQAEVNNAYEIALKVASTGTGLLLRETENTLQATNRAISIQVARGQIEEFNKDYERNSIKPYLIQRNIVFGVGIFSALLALSGTNLLPLFGNINKETMIMIQASFGVLSFSLGLASLFFQSQATLSQHKKDDILNALSEESVCADALAKLLNYEDIAEFKMDDIFSKDVIDFKYNINHINRPNMSDAQIKILIVYKALEHGLIFKVKEEVISPTSIEKYSLNQRFKPSVFKKGINNT